MHATQSPHTFYDRTGRPISDECWADLLRDDDYCTVGSDLLRVGGSLVRVSTVWYGWRLGGADALERMLFETSVFGGSFNGRAWLYPTDAEATLGHRVATELVKSTGCDADVLAARVHDLQNVRRALTA